MYTPQRPGMLGGGGSRPMGMGMHDNYGPMPALFSSQSSPRPSHRSRSSSLGGGLSPQRRKSRGVEGQRFNRRRQEILTAEMAQRAEIISFFDNDRTRLRAMFEEGVLFAKDATITRLEQQAAQTKADADRAARNYAEDLTRISRVASHMMASCLSLGVGGDEEDADRKILAEAMSRLARGLGALPPPPPPQPLVLGYKAASSPSSGEPQPAKLSPGIVDEGAGAMSTTTTTQLHRNTLAYPSSARGIDEFNNNNSNNAAVTESALPTLLSSAAMPSSTTAMRSSSASSSSQSLRKITSSVILNQQQHQPNGNTIALSHNEEATGNTSTVGAVGTPPLVAFSTVSSSLHMLYSNQSFYAATSPSAEVSSMGANALTTSSSAPLTPPLITADQIEKDLQHLSATVQQLLHSAASRVRFSATRLAHMETLLDQQQAQLVATDRMLSGQLLRAPSDIDRSIEMVRHIGKEVSERLDRIESKAVAMADKYLEGPAKTLSYLRVKADETQRRAVRECTRLVGEDDNKNGTAAVDRRRIVEDATQSMALAQARLVDERQRVLNDCRDDVRLLSEEEEELITFLKEELLKLTKKRLAVTIGKSDLLGDLGGSASSPFSDSANNAAFLALPEVIRMQHLDAIEARRREDWARIESFENTRFGINRHPEDVLEEALQTNIGQRLLTGVTDNNNDILKKDSGGHANAHAQAKSNRASSYDTSSPIGRPSCLPFPVAIPNDESAAWHAAATSPTRSITSSRKLSRGDTFATVSVVGDDLHAADPLTRSRSRDSSPTTSKVISPNGSNAKLLKPRDPSRNASRGASTTSSASGTVAAAAAMSVGTKKRVSGGSRGRRARDRSPSAASTSVSPAREPSTANEGGKPHQQSKTPSAVLESPLYVSHVPTPRQNKSHSPSHVGNSSSNQTPASSRLKQQLSSDAPLSPPSAAHSAIIGISNSSTFATAVQNVPTGQASCVVSNKQQQAGMGALAVKEETTGLTSPRPHQLLADPSVLAAHTQHRGGPSHYLMRTNIPPRYRQRLENDTEVFDRRELLRIIDIVSHEPRVAEVIVTIMREYERFEQTQRDVLTSMRAVEESLTKATNVREKVVATQENTAASRTRNNKSENPIRDQTKDGTSIRTHETAGDDEEEEDGAGVLLRPRASTNPPSKDDAGGPTPTTQPSRAAKTASNNALSNTNTSNASTQQRVEDDDLLKRIIKGYSSVDKEINEPFYTMETVGLSSLESEAERKRRREKNSKMMTVGGDGVDRAEEQQQAAAANARQIALNRTFDSLNVGHAVGKELSNTTRQTSLSSVLSQPEEADRYKRYVERIAPASISDGHGYVNDNLYIRGGFREAVMRESYENERERVAFSEMARLQSAAVGNVVAGMGGGSAGAISFGLSGPSAATLPPSGKNGGSVPAAAFPKNVALNPSTVTDPPLRSLLLASPAGRGWYDSAKAHQDSLAKLRERLAAATQSSDTYIKVGGGKENNDDVHVRPSTAPFPAVSKGAAQQDPAAVLPSLADPKARVRNTSHAGLLSSETGQLLTQSATKNADPSTFFYRNPVTQTPWSDRELMVLLKHDEAASSTSAGTRPISSVGAGVLHSKFDDLNPLAFVPVPPRDPSAAARAYSTQQRKLLQALN